MMHAHVRFRLPDGSERLLQPGDVIGRSAGATLVIPDPRVSEAHALVSLRGDSLRLLALRGRFSWESRGESAKATSDESVTDLELRAGLTVFLARDLALHVAQVVLPDAILGLEGPGLLRQSLGSVASLKVGPPPELVQRFVQDADAVFWCDGEHWTVRVAGEEDRPLEAGDSVAVCGREFRAVPIPLRSAAADGTSPIGAIASPLLLVLKYDTVHIHRHREPPVVIDGITARMLSSMAAVPSPVSWESLAADIWPDEDDSVLLRRKWDTNLARLRKRLRESRIRPDLVRADGHGNFEVFLEPGDNVHDQS